MHWKTPLSPKGSSMDSTPLKNRRHEAFCHVVAAGGPAGVAYRELYPGALASTAETEGPRLARTPEVKLRILSLRRAAAERPTEVTLLTMQRRRELCRECAEDSLANWRDRLRAVLFDARHARPAL